MILCLGLFSFAKMALSGSARICTFCTAGALFGKESTLLTDICRTSCSLCLIYPLRSERGVTEGSGTARKMQQQDMNRAKGL